MVYGFHYPSGIHNASIVHWYLEFLWFRGFLRGLVILGKTLDFVWFFTFNYFDLFLARDMDFLILVDSITTPLCNVSRVLVF